MRYAFFDSPVGPLLLGGSDDCLHLVSFPSGRGTRSPKAGWIEDRGAFPKAMAQLTGYFEGERTGFDLPLGLHGNPFQLRVWKALCDIPYGETATYGDIAMRIGEPLAASRAVGAANAANPLPIIVPCHRVIGTGGRLTGFGGGVETKRFLLDLEFRVRPPADTLFSVR